jgi:hypothetical protein
MTKTQITQLEIDVAVMKNDIDFLKDNTKSIKNLLKWFIVLSLGILSIVAVNLWSSAGERKVQKLINKDIKEVIRHNSEIIGDLAQQGIEKGWYNPSKETYRNANDTNKNE